VRKFLAVIKTWARARCGSIPHTSLSARRAEKRTANRRVGLFAPTRSGFGGADSDRRPRDELGLRAWPGVGIGLREGGILIGGRERVSTGDDANVSRPCDRANVLRLFLPALAGGVPCWIFCTQRSPVAFGCAADRSVENRRQSRPGSMAAAPGIAVVSGFGPGTTGAFVSCLTSAGAAAGAGEVRSTSVLAAAELISDCGTSAGESLVGAGFVALSAAASAGVSAG
jgi:hypothetical protein